MTGVSVHILQMRKQYAIQSRVNNNRKERDSTPSLLPHAIEINYIHTYVFIYINIYIEKNRGGVRDRYVINNFCRKISYFY